MATEDGPQNKDWLNECASSLVLNGTVPDTWSNSFPITFGLLRAIIQKLEEQGKILKYDLAPLLVCLKPDLSPANIPTISSIKEQLRRKKYMAHPNTPIPWLVHTEETLGPYCSIAKITISNLSGDISVPSQSLTNGILLELRQYLLKKNLPWRVLSDWLCNLGYSETPVPPKQLQKIVDKVYQGKIKLPRGQFSDTDRNNIFFETVVKLPTVTLDPQSTQKLETQITSLKNKNEHLQQKICILSEEKQVTRAMQNSTLKELEQAEADLDMILGSFLKEQDITEVMNDQIKHAEEEIKTLMASNKRLQLENVTKREQRYNKKIKTQQEQITHLTSETHILKNEINDLKTKLSQARLQRRRFQKRFNHNQSKTTMYKKELDMSKEEATSSKKQLDEATLELEILKDEVIEIVKDKLTIPSFEDGKFTDAVRNTCMQLHSYGVSTANIAACIQCIGEKMFHANVSPLPSETTIRRFIMEANIIGKLHVGKSLLDNQNATLHLDGTTDHQQHFMGFQASTSSSSSLSLAMVEIVQEDTESLMKTFQTILSDYARILSPNADEAESMADKLVMTFKNMMTDQHIVNKKFKIKLEELRARILKDTFNQWDCLDKEEKEKMTHVNQWFCLLHILLGISDAMVAALKEYEAILTNDDTRESGEAPKAIETIKRACSLLSSKGHPVAGVPMDFRAYLSSISAPFYFLPFKHNRFNIIPHNAVAFLYHLQHIRQFLSLTSHDNQLITALKEDIQDETNIAVIKAIAIFHKFITAPFHLLVLSPDSPACHIVDTTPILIQIQCTLEKLSLNPTECFSNPDFQVDSNMPPMNSGMFRCVPANEEIQNEYNALTIESLGLIATSCLVTFTRQISHQLVGGECGDDTDKLRDECMSVPKSNSIGESQFALLKYLRDFKPNASIQHLEATILWAYNKTDDWLKTLSTEERTEVFRKARQKTIDFRDLWTARNKQVLKRRNDLMKAHKDKVEEKRRNAAQTQQKSIDQVLETGGQVKTISEVDEILSSSRSEDDITKIIKTQLQFYKNVIKPDVHRSLYFVTKSGRKLPNAILASNLKEVINTHLASLEPAPVKTQPTSDLRHQKILQTKKSLLATYDRHMSNPAACRGVKRKAPMPDIVGCRINHRWKLGKRNKWYVGRVLSLSSPSKEPSFPEDSPQHTLISYQLYDVIYDGEESEYCVALEKDWHNGDLEVL